MSEPVVLAVPTIMDGVVIYWYRSIEAAERHDSSISASRSRVSVTDLNFETLPNGWLVMMAQNAHEWLERGVVDEAKALATHRDHSATDKLIER